MKTYSIFVKADAFAMKTYNVFAKADAFYIKAEGV